VIYEKYFALAEKQRWQLETLPWDAVDAPLAKSQPEILEKLRDAAIIESYAPMFALKGLEIWWNSVEESAIASIQFYEEYKHYFALKRYLDTVGVEIPDREIVAAREGNFGTHYPDRIRQLANYMISEHFTAHFYERLLDDAKEPVLRTLLGYLVKDELRHCNVFYSLLESHIERDPKTIDTILDEAVHFRHQAAEVVGERVPIAERNDFHALLLFWQKLETLTGVDLRELRRQHV